jgi:hypothetical protein
MGQNTAMALSNAERLRIAQKVIRQKVEKELIETEKDLLDWLKFAQGETDGVERLRIAQRVVRQKVERELIETEKDLHCHGSFHGKKETRYS